MWNFEYKHNAITFCFDELPQLQPQIIKTKQLGWLLRFCNATKPRKYLTVKDWKIKVSGVSHVLDGTILIPKGTLIDGASIPFPWFIAFITFGILRPSGILLTASIPHDFVFTHGTLNYTFDDGDKIEARTIQRHEADKLFYHIIKSVNQAPVTAAISWLAVRLGWYWVKYNGQYRGGRFPFLITFILALGCYFLFS